MKWVEVTNPGSWDGALLALPNPHVMQSWAWGAFKARHGWNVTRVLFHEGRATVAGASVLARRLPGGVASICYVPKGPALDWTDPGLVRRVLGELERLARRQRAIFLKVDPDVYEPEAVPAFSPRPACAPDVAGLLKSRGWRFSDDQIQFRNTVLLDLGRPEDEILANMKSKSRYNVRLAMRRGVVVRPGDEADLDTFYALYAETSARDGFLIRPREYYLDAWGSFLKAGLGRLLLAYVEGELVAGLMLFTFGHTAWYFYGASSDRQRQHMPNQLLQWEAIRLAQAAGCTLYDLWGAPEALDEADPMWGVVRFKLGLGGELVQGLGAWDYPASRSGYWLYTVVLPRYLGLLRRRHRTGLALG